MTIGSGKSTIAQLLLRYYDPLSGNITLDGNPIKDIDPLWMRGEIMGFVSQEPTLFAASIKENIRYGCPEATDEEVIAAAKQANAHDFIISFPAGYSTEVGDRGLSISGGQKQRIAIARALLKNPRILILDESTSALDNQSERVVQEALSRLMQNRTVLVMAHRLTTIQNADRIIVLSNKEGSLGSIIEEGNHYTLLEKKGFYYRLYSQKT